MAVLTAVMLAFTYFAAGFAVCAGVPYTTKTLSTFTSNWSASPFSQNEIADLAVATRDYTVSNHNLDALMAAISDANKKENTPYASYNTEQLLNDTPEAYSLNSEAISHLDDVFDVISTAFMPLLGIAVIAAFCLMGTLRMFGTKPVAKALRWSGIATLVVFALCGIWALVGFDGMFAALHSVFFADGTWTFPADSLLICMYPTAFWIGMGLVWLCTSCVIAILSLVFGAALTKRSNIEANGMDETVKSGQMN